MHRMTSLTKSLENRIQELKAAIESQRAELAAYEKVLEVERSSSPQTSLTEVPSLIDESVPAEAGTQPRSGTDPIPEFTGNKTAFIAAIIKARGSAGATPKEISEIFASRGVARSKNLIHTALSSLLKQKKLQRREGRYFSGPGVSSQISVAPTKRKMSAAGLASIREANRKRWAKEKAPQRATAKSSRKKVSAGKKAAPARSARGKKAPAKRATA